MNQITPAAQIEEGKKAVVASGSLVKDLIAAQTAMGKVVKGKENAHFKNKYADLHTVIDACRTALHDNNFALLQPTVEDGRGEHFVETILLHTSGESVVCRFPLLVDKKNMQGFGSAVTYARRYGLMAMAGLAPEDDDDGNLAAQNAPSVKPKGQPRDWERLASKMIEALKNPANDLHEVIESPKFKANLQDMQAAAPEIAGRVQTEINNTRQLDGDQIPF